jgi:glycerol-3-phosphate dehydrogenase subunit B
VRNELRFDAVVIGAGMAGLVAGTRLAEEGARVCVVAKGVGSTHLAPGTIDVLGYAPDKVAEPGAALATFLGEHPGHPYALVGGVVGEALEWFGERVAAGPLPDYRYVGGLDRNQMLPTALGALRPSAFVPETMSAGEAGSLGRVCVVGSRSLRDFHPSLCAANLAAAGITARGLEIALEVSRADTNSLALARHFEDAEWRASFAAELALKLRDDDQVGLPAVLGIADPHAVWTDLQHRLGRPVFEIPTLPPSVPGMRMFEILRSAIRSAGGRLVLGAEVFAADRDGSRVTSVSAHASGRDVRYSASSFVLATGGFNSGAIRLDSSWKTTEQVLGLPLSGLPAEGEPRFNPDYLTEQPMARVGIAVDGDLRAEGAENVLVVGAALPGAVPWREGCGEGVSLASGYRAAQVVLADAGATAKATA